MKKEIVITDLTRMQEGRVCVAGYDRQGHCIRPTLPPPGIHESTLYGQGRPSVYPFAVVEYDLLQAVPEPPHTEDYRYNPSTVRFIKRVDEKAKREILDRTLFASVRSVFETLLYFDYGCYVKLGQGVRSLGTIRPQQIQSVIHDLSPENKWQYRLVFNDGEGQIYRLTVTDLAWRYYHDRQREQGCAPIKIAAELTAALQSRDVYLRVGLARGWAKFPDRCFVQVTGVYTFPDYLEGQTFADFAFHKK